MNHFADPLSNSTEQIPNPATNDEEEKNKAESQNNALQPSIGQISREEHESALAQARAKELRLERQLADFRAMRQAEILQSSISSWAIDPEAVMSMTQNHFGMDETGQLHPVDSQGALLSGKDGKPLSLEQYFQRFRQEKPYLVKASAQRGAGSSSEAVSAASAFRPTIEQMADLPMAQFIQAGGLQKGTGHF
jgi:hypothetical protein